ncbi:TetR/AcrR family transcriptional regulator [bacterium]|nr:TetR/AcrR family transcriptional regulator [bacterium]
MTPKTKPLNPRKQPRQARSAATIEVILEAAARILESDGLAAFNTNAVAAKAGVSIGSLYQYFPSKEALLAEWIRIERSKLADAIAQHSIAAETADFDTMVDGFIDAAIHHQLERPRLAATLEYIENSLPIAEETAALKQAINNDVARTLVRFGIAQPELAAQDLSALTRGMVDTAGMLGETDRDSLKHRVRRAIYGYLQKPLPAAAKTENPAD